MLRHFLPLNYFSNDYQSDRIAALALAVQASPVHEMAAFDSLIGRKGKGSDALLIHRTVLYL